MASVDSADPTMRPSPALASGAPAASAARCGMAPTPAMASRVNERCAGHSSRLAPMRRLYGFATEHDRHRPSDCWMGGHGIEP
jgi:hypothetical protein